ncbi:hypothetical protein EDEG_00113 [Edhazardia aedis USNM 41457]|uniref:Amino acid transporter transmembrane domain-containing protein n=1 Tax=Edhazardia aedis (strain USNM 41457) TaxID=1003232 RepID=J8ZYY2_EDHAE|nr:hypothetical protein EDEG_00113 [Edhazardia aedis USNM 41457]|eukprot:EJW04893.1 hypothetical protein EDEG_00113 [Edhazardia aedis USNM 41457]
MNHNYKTESYRNPVISIVKSTLGSSVVCLPYVIQQLGIIFGLICFVFFAILNIFSHAALAFVARNNSSHSYTELVSKMRVGGSFGLFFCCFIIVLDNTIGLTFYIYVSSCYYHLVLMHIGFHTPFWIVHSFTAASCVILCFLFRSEESVATVNVISLICLFLFTIYVVVSVIYHIPTINWKKLTLFSLEKKLATSFSKICFSYSSHFNIVTITTDIKSQNICKKSILLANFISFLFYTITAIAGYILQPNASPTFFKESDLSFAKLLLNLALGTVNVTSYPYLMSACRTSFITLSKLCKTSLSKEKIEAHREKKMLNEIVLTTAISLVTFSISLGISWGYNLMDPIVSITCSVIMFFLPATFLLLKYRKNLDITGYVFCFICICLATLGVYCGIVGMFHVCGSIVSDMIN